jgi:hypothetical protein
VDWHHTPKDGAWREAHLAMLVKLGMGLHLRCDACHHSVSEDPRLFAARHNLELLTPMLTISKVLRCTRCGARKGRAMPEPSTGAPSRSGS